MSTRTAICLGLLLALGLLTPRPLAADVIHLKNGSRLEVDAWRDVGTAIEFARGGGIVRIPKSEVRRVEGKPTRGGLRMYSAPPAPPEVEPAAGAVAAAPMPEVAGRMLGLLGEGEALIDRGALEPDEKASAYRRLLAEWRELEAPESLADAIGQGEQVLLQAVQVFTAADAGSEVEAEIEQVRQGIAATQEAVRKATEAEG